MHYHCGDQRKTEVICGSTYENKEGEILNKHTEFCIAIEFHTCGLQRTQQRSKTLIHHSV